MKYLATFYTHYGAMRFQKIFQKDGLPAKLMPVPRELSSSCGVCVRFEAACAPKTDEHEDLERCYVVTAGGSYAPVEE